MAMRDRGQILNSLEGLYRAAYARAETTGGEDQMAQLDFEFQRDQLYMEAILDVRELLEGSTAGGTTEEPSESLLDKAQSVRKLMKGR